MSATSMSASRARRRRPRSASAEAPPSDGRRGRTSRWARAGPRRRARRAPAPGDRRRRAHWAHAEVGDEVIVNVQALDLGLGSGGFDIVHVNLTRGLAGGRRARAQRDEAQLHEPAAHRHAGRGREAAAARRAARGGAGSARSAGRDGLGVRAGARRSAGWGTCRPRGARSRAGTRVPFAPCARAGCSPAI